MGSSMEGTNPFDNQHLPREALELITFDWASDALEAHQAVRGDIVDRYRQLGPERQRQVGAVAVMMSWPEEDLPVTIDTKISTNVIPDAFSADLLKEPDQTYVDAVLAFLVHHAKSLTDLSAFSGDRLSLGYCLDLSATARSIANLRQTMAVGDELRLARFASADSPELVLAPSGQSGYNAFFRNQIYIVDLA